MRVSALLTTVALVVGASGSTAAFAADPDVFAGLALGGANYTSPSGDSEGTFIVQGLASGAYNFTPVLGAQGDLVLRDEKSDYETIWYFDAAGHLFYRDSDKFLIGGLAQIGHDVSEYGSDTTERNRGYLGLEAQGFLDMVTLYGQVGVVWAEFPGDYYGSANGFFATGEARYFLTPNFKVDIHGGVSVMSPEDAPSGDYNTTNLNLGIGAEYRPDNMPVSFFAKLDTFNSSMVAYDESTSEVRILFGIRGNFGTDTLFDRDRGGASLKPVEPEFANYLYEPR